MRELKDTMTSQLAHAHRVTAPREGGLSRLSPDLFGVDAPAREPIPTPAPVVPRYDAIWAKRGRPLRILMVVESSAGGTGRHVLDLSEGLSVRGCEVHLIHSTRRIDKMFIERVASIKGLHRQGLPLRTAIHPEDIAATLAIRQYLKRLGPFDIIHGHSSKGGALAPCRGGIATARARVLHAACMGLEGDPERYLRELAHERLLRRLQRRPPVDQVRD